MEKILQKNRVLELVMAILLLTSMVLLSKSAANMVASNAVIASERIVVIDVGHGGDDPGKVGVNGVLEKDINLLIAKRLKVLLEANDIKVIMTRDVDKGLYDEASSNKKVQDMKNRLQMIETSNPQLVISIHQNSYHQESICGAQVFYFKSSEKGKEIATLLQNQLITRVDPENHREAKENDNYYLLKKTSKPIVIVECGFLSNWEEAENLNTKEYQEKVAWALHMGVLEYLNTKK